MEIIETLKKGFRKKPNRWLIPLLGLGLFHSCVVEDEGSYQGKLSLELVSDTTLVQNQTRASSLLELNSFANTADYAVEILQGTTSVQKYDRYDKLPDEVSLKPGDYTIQVSKGKNEPAAYSSPYFTGKQDFTITEGMTTPVTVTASMANSRVTVDLSDDFIETYPEYTLSFMTNKMKTPLEYEPGSPMYFQADAAGTKLTIAMELVNAYDKEVEYTATTTIKPKQWAALTVRTDEKGINGLAVDVTLNDGTNETIYVNIGIPDFMEQLKGAPWISSEGTFQWLLSNNDTTLNKTVSTISSIKSTPINITAGGKIAKANMEVLDESGVKVLSYDFANLTAEQKAELKDKYEMDLKDEIKGAVSAMLDIEGILKSLLAGEDKVYTLSLTVVDALPVKNTTTKKAELTYKAVAMPKFATQITVNPYTTQGYEQGEKAIIIHNLPLGVKSVLFGVEGSLVDVTTGNVPNISFKEANNAGTMYKFAIAPEWFNSLRAGEYIYIVKVTDVFDREITTSFQVNVLAPEFSWAMADNDGDVFAKYAYLRVKANNAEKVTFYQNGVQIPSTELVSLGRDNNGIVTYVWKGLTPNTLYSGITAKYDEMYELGATSFTTEINNQLPNNEFLDWDVTNWDYEITYLVYNAKKTERNFNFSAKNWVTNNNKTLYYTLTQPIKGTFSQKIFPTVTYINEGNDSKSAVIRSVASGNLNTDDIMLGNVAGEIYYTGKLTSRPTSLSYTYKYMPYSSDKYKIYVKIIGESGTTLVEQTYIPETSTFNDGFVTNTIPLTYSSLVEKAKSIEVHFYSSEQNEPPTEKNRMVTLPQPNGNTYKTHSGSTLIIDNVILNY